jgi:ElaB/YqjD/DUF883 family membrane-anchored ribosome-binding protein
MPKYQVETNQGKFEVELDRAPASSEELMSAVQAHLSQAQAPAEPQQEMTPEQFTQTRQQAATQEPAFQSLARATIPTLAAGASMIPGVGPLAAGAISAGGTALNQAVGMEPYDPKQIAISGALPAAGSAIMGAGKMIGRAGGKLFAPAAAKESGVEAIAQTAGAKPTSAARAFSTPMSKAAFDAVAQQGPVSTKGVNKAIKESFDEIASMSNPSEKAAEYLTNMSAKYGPKGAASYDDIAKEMSALRTKADELMKGDDHLAGRSLHAARAKILNELDNISPAIKEANKLYRREESTQAIINAVRSGNSGDKIRRLFENNKLVKDTFSQKEYEEMTKIADQISNMATSSVGWTNRAWNALVEPIGAALATKTGRYLMRQSMLANGGKMTAQGLATTAQFMRAYQASGAEDKE